MSAVPAGPSPRLRVSGAPSSGGSPRPDLRVVPVPRAARRYVAMCTVVAALAIFGCVALNALTAEQAFATRTLQAEVAELSQRHDELAVEVAALEAPDRILRVAQRRLGMVPAGRSMFVELGATRRAASDDSAAETGNLAAPPADAPPGG